MKAFPSRKAAQYCIALFFIGAMVLFVHQSREFKACMPIARAESPALLPLNLACHPELSECWYSFIFNEVWRYQHPDCSLEVHLNGECKPSADLIDCAPSGDHVIGDLMVYFENSPLASYRLVSHDGVVESIMLDEF